MSAISKRAMRRERRRTAAQLREATRDLEDLRKKREMLERRIDLQARMILMYQKDMSELRHRKASVLRGLIPVAEWPYTVSP